MASQSQDRLDDMLTAAMDYRQELAREVRARASLMQEQFSKMLEAAAVLDGTPPPPPGEKVDAEEVKRLKRQVETLGRELNSSQMEVQREREKAARAGQVPVPDDAPTVILRAAGAKDNPKAQLVLSVPSMYRDAVKPGENYRVAVRGDQVIFARGSQPQE